MLSFNLIHWTVVNDYSNKFYCHKVLQQQILLYYPIWEISKTADFGVCLFLIYENKDFTCSKTGKNLGIIPWRTISGLLTAMTLHMVFFRHDVFSHRLLV